MATDRAALPQLTGTTMLTDGGLETDLIFHHGVDLPHFASFPLVDDEAGRMLLREYYERYIDIAADAGVGFVLETPTWRANPDWATLLGYDATALDTANRRAVEQMLALRDAHRQRVAPVVVSGCLGPRGDGYVVGATMEPDEAAAYHTRQIEVLAEAGVDLISAFTMTYAAEAIGIARAAQAARVPVAISFTVETDGRLPSGQALGDAIREVDAATGRGPAYFMINCAHPTHFVDVLEEGADWIARVVGLRANASMCSHAELDAAEELDDGDPADLGRAYRRLADILPNLTVIGGCCGTDHRHVAEMSAAWGVPAR